MLTDRGILVGHETTCRWGQKFVGAYASEICRHQRATSDKRHFDKVVITVAGKTTGYAVAVDHHGVVLDIPVRNHCDARAAKRMLPKMMK